MFELRVDDGSLGQDMWIRFVYFVQCLPNERRGDLQQPSCFLGPLELFSALWRNPAPIESHASLAKKEYL